MTEIDSLLNIAIQVSLPTWTGSGINRIVLAPPAETPSWRPLIFDEPNAVPDWVRYKHLASTPTLAEGLSCYFISDLIVSGRGHMFHNGKIIVAGDVMPEYWKVLIRNGRGIDLKGESLLPTRKIMDPCIVFGGHGISVYGHFVAEMLPKLLVARASIPSIFTQAKILLDNDAPFWLRDILRQALDVKSEQFEFYFPKCERVLLSQAIVPSLTQTGEVFHPDTVKFFDEIKYKMMLDGKGARCPKVFITRAFHQSMGGPVRRCVNELEVAGIAAREFGYAIIAIETLPWAEQIKIFANAEVVIGEYGSALHNSVFARSRTVIAGLGYDNTLQSALSAVSEQRNAFMSKSFLCNKSEFKIDCEIFRRMISSIAQFLDHVDKANPLPD